MRSRPEGGYYGPQKEQYRNALESRADLIAVYAPVGEGIHGIIAGVCRARVRRLRDALAKAAALHPGRPGERHWWCPVTDLTAGFEELTGLISFRVGAWHDLGYATPPAPDCKTIPPLGERSADAIKSGHEAIETIDELTRQLSALRGQLVDELREDSDIRAARTEARLAAPSVSLHWPLSPR